MDQFPEEIHEPEEKAQGQDHQQDIDIMAEASKRIFLQEIELALSDLKTPATLAELYLRLAKSENLRHLDSFSSLIRFKNFWKNLCKDSPMIQAQWKTLSGSQKREGFDS